MAKYKCPHCNKEIEPSEVFKKDLDSLAAQQKQKIKKEFEDSKRKELIQELKPELLKEAKDDVQLDHNKELEKERLGRERAEKHTRRIKEQLDKATKPTTQGSPEVDGESQERVLEKYLQKRFPTDSITPVPKGKKGADCIQEVVDKSTKCGKILWESKDTDVFLEKYVSTLLKDMSDNDIGFGILAVDVLPKSCKEEFEFRENKKIILCKFKKGTLDAISSMVREMAITVTKQKRSESKNLSKSQIELWNLFKSDTFIINFRNILKATIKENKQLLKDETTAAKSFKNRKQIINERKDDLIKIIKQFSSVEGTLITPDLIELQDREDIEN